MCEVLTMLSTIYFSLLNLGFEDFIRVGSVKKIAKPVLPYRYKRKIIITYILSTLPATVAS